MEFLNELNWLAVGQIILIDILLGGDNAIMIALACRNLPAHQRTRGILWGTAGAIVLRIALIAFAVNLLEIPFLKLVGGLLLLWIGVKLMIEEEEEHEVSGSDRLFDAVRTVIIADLVMSVDNVVGVTGAAEAAGGDYRLLLVAFGILVSIPIVIWGSSLVLKVMERFPVIITVGAAMLGYLAGSMIFTDAGLTPWIVANLPDFHPQLSLTGMQVSLPGLAGALAVPAIASWLVARRTAAARSTD